MPATEAMLDRSAHLKRALVEFAQEQRFDAFLTSWLNEHLGEECMQRQEDAIDALDTFVLHHHLPDGRSLLECFVGEHPELPATDREMVQGWEDSVEGIFEVRRRDKDALVVHNLVDDLDYRLRANAGPRVLDRMRSGSFLICRIVPIADEWLMSGVQTVLPRQDREMVYGAAVRLAQHDPKLVFRNPKLLEAAWQSQQSQREAFLAFFGSDCVIVPGAELPQRLQSLMRYQQNHTRGADGLTAVEWAQQAHETLPDPPEPDLDEQLTSVPTVAMLCDEIDGLTFLPEFDLVEEVFAKPELVRERRHREAVEDYLYEPSFSPRLFERLAAPDPERASRVFRRLLDQRDFDWQRDGEALLRRVKGAYYAEPVLPAIVPLNDTLGRYAAQSGAERSGKPKRTTPKAKAQKKRRRR